MVTLSTNQPWFYNDICEEMRLFLDLTNIIPVESEPPMSDGDIHMSINLYERGSLYEAHAVCSYMNGSQRLTGDCIHTAAARTEGEIIVKRHKKRCTKIAAFRAMEKLFPQRIPWGSLTGIRPTRLWRELLETMSCNEAAHIMLDEFDVTPEKLKVAADITRVQQKAFAAQTPNDIDIYIGIPYCKSKCLYCSFASCVRTPKTDIGAYLDALKKDILYGSRTIAENGFIVRAMYVGGGTPTVLTNDELDDLITYALECYGGFGTEFTVEAGRPDTIDMQKLLTLRRLGVGRISINPQTMNNDTLALIGRSHTADDISRAYFDARAVGFESINADVIAGLPGESDSHMQRTMEAIAALKPDNLTVHTLALKRSSALMEHLAEYKLPEAAEVERMVETGARAASEMGMRPYYMYRQKYMRGNLENIGYSLPGRECIYNIDMMEETTSIMAHGAGAMSKRIFDAERRVERIPNPKDIATYINKLDATATEKNKLFSQERGCI